MTETAIRNEMKDIIARVRWQEGRDGSICRETRLTALKVLLGLANKVNDNNLKSLILKAYNFLNKM